MINPKKDAKCFTVVDGEIQEFLAYDFTVSAEEAAEEVGCYVITPGDNQLFLDIDSEEVLTSFHRRWKEVSGMQHYGSEIGKESTVKITPSKSGLPNRHIVVTLFDNYGERYKITESQRIMLQFALGSDPVRETLSVYRWLCRVENPTRFFEPNEDME